MAIDVNRLDPILPQKPAVRQRAVQMLAWSMPPGLGADVNFTPPSPAPDRLALHLVPLVDLTAALSATRLAVYAEVSHADVQAPVPLVLSLWRSNANPRIDDGGRGVWSARLLDQTPIVQIENPSAVETVTKPVIGRLSRTHLLEPGRIYFVGLQADETDGARLIVRAPQGAAGIPFLSAWTTDAIPQTRFRPYPRAVTPIAQVTHFFAAALSDAAHQFFLGGS